MIEIQMRMSNKYMLLEAIVTLLKLDYTIRINDENGQYLTIWEGSNMAELHKGYRGTCVRLDWDSWKYLKPYLTPITTFEGFTRICQYCINGMCQRENKLCLINTCAMWNTYKDYAKSKGIVTK